MTNSPLITATAADDTKAEEGRRPRHGIDRGERRALLAAIACTCAVFFSILSIVEVEPAVIDRYDALAESILEGHGLSFGNGPTLSRGPFYPLWLSFELALTGHSLPAVRLLEFAPIVAIVILVFLTTRAIGNTREAFVAALISGTYPPFIYYSIKIGSETFSALVFAAAALFAVRTVHTRRLRSDAVFGLLAGTLVLIKSAFLVCVVARGISLASTVRIRTWAPRLLVSVAFCGLVVAPWWIRNVRTVGTGAPLQTLVWWNFWYDFDLDRAWLQGAIGKAGAVPQAFTQFGADYRGHPYDLTAVADAAQERFLRDRAATWIRQHPVEVCRKVFLNCCQFWSLVSSRRGSLLLGFASLGLVALMTLGLRVVITRGHSGAAIWMISVPLMLTLVMSPILGVFRHSLVLVPVMAPSLGIGFVAMLARLRGAAEASPGTEDTVQAH